MLKKTFCLLFTFLLFLPSMGLAYTFDLEEFSLANFPTGVNQYLYGRPDFPTPADPSVDLQGTYLGTGYKETGDGANITLSVIQDLLDFSGITVNNLNLLGKSDDTNPAITTPSIQLNVDNEAVAGTWIYTPSAGDPSLIDLILVKGSDSFSLHLYNPDTDSGEWNVGYLAENDSGFTPQLSHLSGYLTDYDIPGGVNPIPEPTTMFLLGAGLLAIAGISRKKS